MLAWGLFASAFGLPMVTNIRGFADNFARRAEASSAGLIFGIGIAVGQTTIGIAAWAVGGLLSLVLLTDGKRAGSEPGSDRD